MGIRMVMHENGRTGLEAFCDVCGKQAIDWYTNVLWEPSSLNATGDKCNILFACKDKCTSIVDKELGRQYSQELGVSLVYLINNSEVDLKQAINNARTMAEIQYY